MGVMRRPGVACGDGRTFCEYTKRRRTVTFQGENRAMRELHLGEAIKNHEVV